MGEDNVSRERSDMKRDELQKLEKMRDDLMVDLTNGEAERSVLQNNVDAQTSKSHITSMTQQNDKLKAEIKQCKNKTADGVLKHMLVIEEYERKLDEANVRHEEHYKKLCAMSREEKRMLIRVCQQKSQEIEELNETVNTIIEQTLKDFQRAHERDIDMVRKEHVAKVKRMNKKWDAKLTKNVKYFKNKELDMEAMREQNEERHLETIQKMKQELTDMSRKHKEQQRLRFDREVQEKCDNAKVGNMQHLMAQLEVESKRQGKEIRRLTESVQQLATLNRVKEEQGAVKSQMQQAQTQKETERITAEQKAEDDAFRE